MMLGICLVLVLFAMAWGLRAARNDDFSFGLQRQTAKSLGAVAMSLLPIGLIASLIIG